MNCLTNVSTSLMNEIPKLAQNVVTGGQSNDQVCCCQCRARVKLFRCTRCQVTHYCSRECQIKHLSFHKKLCKRVSLLRLNVETCCDETLDVVSKFPNPTSIDLINTLLVMGYRETDTVENGKFYYRKALHYCFELLSTHIMEESSFGSAEFQMDDLVLLLLGILGATATTIASWCKETFSHRKSYFSPEVSDASNVFTTPQSLGCDDFTFHMVGLLVSMRSLAAQQSDPSCQPDVNDLPSQIKLLITAMKRHGHFQAMIHLRDTIPFSPEHAPRLAPLQQVPAEIWYLYQDCFFMTPGVNNLLHEFLPEDEDPIDSLTD